MSEFNLTVCDDEMTVNILCDHLGGTRDNNVEEFFFFFRLFSSPTFFISQALFSSQKTSSSILLYIYYMITFIAENNFNFNRKISRDQNC